MWCTQWSTCIVQVNIYITENTGHVVYMVEYLHGQVNIHITENTGHVVYTVEYLHSTGKHLHYSEHRPCGIHSGVPAWYR
ncbi:hypothetical protein DPMN_174152 [Dreissena polymorpha]|uniref:Uncharacterized protein n=1 Tax=Dreissena polymorpha TaxID=45954 RepID=A0A9D4IG61_DREPO|nr:hypothetical protein DPMN_174152 [Dreissena polymorpha]